MDDLLVGAAMLCACKFTCSFPFLPSLNYCSSPVSFCCCCLLVLTDFLVTVFLALLHMFDYWVTDVSPAGDAIALRFLLFLSHTYGAAFLLTIPLIAVDLLTRRLWTHCDREGAAAAGEGEEEEEEEEEEEKQEGSNSDTLSRAVGYLCCLSVWVAVALVVRWRWTPQEDVTAVCLLTANSLLRCLPNLLSPISSPVYPCWGMVFLFFLVLLLSTILYMRHRRPAHTEEKHRIIENGAKLVSAQSAPSSPVDCGTPPSASAQRVDPEKTHSSCTVHGTRSGSVLQMPRTRHHGDVVLVSYRGELGWRHWAFPCLWLNVTTALVFVLCMLALPLILSVNVVTVRCAETLMELYVARVLKSPALTGANASSSFHKV